MRDVCLCESFAVAVAGGRLKTGAGRHEEREREHSGREGEDCEGCPLLSLCEMAASDSHHPLCWGSVLRHQRCMFSSAFPLKNTLASLFQTQLDPVNGLSYFFLSSSCIFTPLTSSVSLECLRTRCITWPLALEPQSSSQ